MNLALSWACLAAAAVVFIGCSGKEEPPNTRPVGVEAGAPSPEAMSSNPPNVPAEGDATTDAEGGTVGLADIDAGPSSAFDDALPGNDAAYWQSCSGPGDCALAQRGCCAGFYVPEDYAAIRRDRLGAYRQAVCPSTVWASGGGCDASVEVNDGLAAFCIDGTCKHIVIPQDPISACSTDNDCELVSSSCEPSCVGFGGALAIRTDQFATYAQQVCPGSDPQSLQCPPQNPDAGPNGKCGADGHCVSRYPF